LWPRQCLPLRRRRIPSLVSLVSFTLLPDCYWMVELIYLVIRIQECSHSHFYEQTGTNLTPMGQMEEIGRVFARKSGVLFLGEGKAPQRRRKGEQTQLFHSSSMTFLGRTRQMPGQNALPKCPPNVQPKCPLIFLNYSEIQGMRRRRMTTKRTLIKVKISSGLNTLTL
jgi:hypothetical protein